MIDNIQNILYRMKEITQHQQKISNLQMEIVDILGKEKDEYLERVEKPHAKREIEKVIEKAKAQIEKEYGSLTLGNGENKRKWLTADIDSYQSPSNRMSVLVLEGSPPKGFIIVSYGHGEVIAFDNCLKKLETYNLGYSCEPIKDN